MVDVHHGVFSDHYQIRSSIFLSPEYDINLLVKNSHRNKYHQQISSCEFSFQSEDDLLLQRLSTLEGRTPSPPTYHKGCDTTAATTNGDLVTTTLP